MIKPLNTPQLSAARPRVGLQRVSDLIPRLIKMYEMQAELTKQEIQKEVNEREAAEMTSREFEATEATEATEETDDIEHTLLPVNALTQSLELGSACEQATFGWYE